eukprot:COSAG03_NODE_11793_length_575_cov_3.142433_3_plen_27_part_01
MSYTAASPQIDASLAFSNSTALICAES